MERLHGFPPLRTPTGRLFVPVRRREGGHLIRFFRTVLGRRTVVGFTSRARLARELGDDQACVELAEPTLRALAEPLGVTRLIVDPHLLTAPVPAQTILTSASLETEQLPPRAPIAPAARGRRGEVSPRRRASGPGSSAKEQDTYRS